MAIKIRSAKAKGRNFQTFVANELYKAFPELRQGDIKPAVGSETGEDIKLSPQAREWLPVSIECKAVESLNIWKALEQAQSNASTYEPIVVFKRNRSKVFATISFEFLLELLRANKKKEN